MSGLNSLNQFSKASKVDISRSVLEDFLNLPYLPTDLRKYVENLNKQMIQSKMTTLNHVKGMIVAAADGVETGRTRYTPENFEKKVVNNFFDAHCQIAVHLSKDGIPEWFEVYNRLVLISIITDRGPMPYAWQYQKSELYKEYINWYSGLTTTDKQLPPWLGQKSSKLSKQEGELTTLKNLMKELTNDGKDKPVFDILIGDGLYDKSTILTEVETSKVALIAVLKDETRLIRQEAMEDFETSKPLSTWVDNNTLYEAWSGTYQDNNLLRADKTVKIIRVKRTTKGQVVDNYFYCSNFSCITPRLVEACRHYRWHEENGFNVWTNKWEILKHLFHHTYNASDAMMGLMFVVIIIVENFRKGNLKRGNHWKHQYSTLKSFFRSLIMDWPFRKRQDYQWYLLFYLGT